MTEIRALSKVLQVTGVELRQISAGRSHAAAVMRDGRLFMWGCNRNGEVMPINCGSSPTIAAGSAQSSTSGNARVVAVPVLIRSFLRTGRKVLRVACGDGTTACIVAGAGVYVWGGHNGHNSPPQLVAELSGHRVHDVCASSNACFSFLIAPIPLHGRHRHHLQHPRRSEGQLTLQRQSVADHRNDLSRTCRTARASIRGGTVATRATILNKRNASLDGSSHGDFGASFRLGTTLTSMTRPFFGRYHTFHSAVGENFEGGSHASHGYYNSPEIESLKGGSAGQSAGDRRLARDDLALSADSFETAQMVTSGTIVVSGSTAERTTTGDRFLPKQKRQLVRAARSWHSMRDKNLRRHSLQSDSLRASDGDASFNGGSGDDGAVNGDSFEIMESTSDDGSEHWIHCDEPRLAEVRRGTMHASLSQSPTSSRSSSWDSPRNTRDARNGAIAAKVWSRDTNKANAAEARAALTSRGGRTSAREHVPPFPHSSGRRRTPTAKSPFSTGLANRLRANEARQRASSADGVLRSLGRQQGQASPAGSRSRDQVKVSQSSPMRALSATARRVGTQDWDGQQAKSTSVPWLARSNVGGAGLARTRRLSEHSARSSDSAHQDLAPKKSLNLAETMHKRRMQRTHSAEL